MRRAKIAMFPLAAGIEAEAVKFKKAILPFVLRLSPFSVQH